MDFQSTFTTKEQEKKILGHRNINRLGGGANLTPRTYISCIILHRRQTDRQSQKNDIINSNVQ